MGLVDIDVIAKGGKKDLALKTFHKKLTNQAALAKAFNVADEKKLIENVLTVFDMVDRIVASIGPSALSFLDFRANRVGFACASIRYPILNPNFQL